MTWVIPNWYALALLALAAYRLWRLLALDTILDRWRNLLIGSGHADDVRARWYEFVTCPYCAGAWITVGWWLAWVAWPHWTLVVAVPCALSALVGLIGSRLDPD